MSVFNDLRDLAADILEVSPESLSAESSPETVDSWDSVQHLNLILAIEEQFEIQLDPEAIGGASNLGELAALVDEVRSGA